MREIAFLCGGQGPWQPAAGRRSCAAHDTMSASSFRARLARRNAREEEEEPEGVRRVRGGWV
eukprot:709404-Rhodomonas_salina.2